jgi:hypothetical protein
LGIDAVAGRAVHQADVGDAALRDSHVGDLWGASQAVKNLRIADDQVMHLSETLLL